MANTAADGFKEFIDRLVPSSSERAKAASHRQTIYDKLDASFGLYRMFQTGSFKHGTGVSGYSDVDYFVSLKTERPSLSSSTLTAARDRLQQRFPSTYIRVARPAVVLEFGSGYERVEIIPAYANITVADSMRFWIPGLTSEWLESTPESHLSYVNTCNELPSPGAAKAFVRVVKAWKYYKNVPISSFYLEMRAATYMARQKSDIYAYDLPYFLNELAANGLAAMSDPTGETGRIAAYSSDASRIDALSKLETAKSRATKALDFHKEGETRKAFAQWDLLFDGHFPAYY
jgi:hypothetical protein